VWSYEESFDEARRYILDILGPLLRPIKASLHLFYHAGNTGIKHPPAT
jgi:hypothetical protein